ncbi:MAG: hypothetical protein ACRBN8_29360 [Nannocystales bacterium]
MKTTWTWFFDVTLCALTGCVLAGCPSEDDDGGEVGAATTSSTGEAAGEATGGATPSSGGAESTSTSDAPTSASGTTTTTAAETSDSAASSSEGSSEGGDTEAATYAVSGTVTRSAMLPNDGDGVGTLVVGAFAECTLQAPIVLGAAIIPNADLSADDASVEFMIEPLPEGSVFLVSFLDDDGNLDPDNPLPDDGDPVLAEGVGDGILTCIEVVIDGDDVPDVVVDLNEIAMPQG